MIPALMFGNSREGPNSLRPGFTGDQHIVADTLTAPKPDHELVDGKRQDGGRTDKIPVTVTEGPQAALTTEDGASRCLTGKKGDRYDGDTETFVVASPHNSGVPTSQRIHEEVAPTLQSSRTPNRGGSEGPMIAAPLSHGSNPHSNMAGRRREDDENLVIANTLKAQEGRGWSHDAEATYVEDEQEVTAFHMLQDPISEEGSTPAWGKGNKGGTASVAVAIPISSDALRGEGEAKTPSADAEGNVRLRDPGMAVGEDGDPAFTINATDPGAVAFAQNQRGELREMGDTSSQLTTGGGKPGEGYPAVRAGAAVRRLTPVECERLQGFPDNWTKLEEKTPDSKRYAALGDAVTVPVPHWIGWRISQLEGEEIVRPTG